MAWSNQQNAAINAVSAWLKDKKGPQVFRLFGYAGSGKTTLAKHLAQDLADVRYACFTGKAALVLRKKGCSGASTIHSLIYKPKQDDVTGETEFVLNPESGAAFADLIVVDEVSMVGEELAQDLLSFGRKVLVLGDPAQLPPVKGEGYFINAQPDVMLTEVHRQAQDNPIIRMSMEVREGRRLQPGAYDGSLVLRRGELGPEILRDYVLQADQLLCGLNKTRQAFNGRIRQLKGLQGEEAPFIPAPGDRLVCLRNNRNKALLNGGLWEVQTARLGYSWKQVEARVKSLDEPEAAPIDVRVPIQFFTGAEKELQWRDRRDHDEFTFGWALTCHKAQGSQWDNVIVFDEGAVFGADAARWTYTAITRAAEKVVVVQ